MTVRRSRCRSCRAEIVWATVDATGKAMPLDPEPVDHGNVVRLRFRPPTDPRAAEVVLVRVLSAGDVVEPHVPRYVSHFVTCPDAQAHRRRGRL